MKERWWKTKDVSKSVWEALSFLMDQQRIVHAADLHFLRMYSNRSMTSANDVFSALNVDEKIRMNVIRSCIDTAVAQIAAEFARPMHLTEGADFSTKKRNEQLDSFLVGAMNKGDAHPKALDVFRDACIHGTGVMKVLIEHGDVCFERVPITEFLVDEIEAKYGRPRQFFHFRDVSKDFLRDMGGITKGDLDASTVIDWEMNVRESLSDMCTLVEAWKLPSFRDAPDGRHVICTSSCVLLDEPWSHQEAPFAFFHWQPPTYGFRGYGVVEELTPIQIEINYIAQKIQRLMNFATSQVWVEEGTKVGQITNKDFSVNKYTGHPPIFQTTASVSAEYFQHLDRLYNRAYEIIGISQLSAQSEKPAGLESGVALQTYHDIGSRRFRHTGKRWGRFFCDLGERIIDACEREDGDVTILSAGKHSANKLNFKSVALDRDSYIVKVYPVNALPDEPAGKLDKITQLAQNVPDLQPYLLQLLTGVPDLESVANQLNAPREIAENMVDAILMHGIFEPPYPEMDLVMARQIGTNAVLRAQIDKVDEERIEMLRRWNVMVDDMSQAAQPAPQPAPEGMPPMPMPGMVPQG